MNGSTCSLCGASGDGSGYCPRCGQRMSDRPQTASPPTPPPAQTTPGPTAVSVPPIVEQTGSTHSKGVSRRGPSRVVLIPLAGVAAVLVLVVVAVVISRRDSSTPTASQNAQRAHQTAGEPSVSPEPSATDGGATDAPDSDQQPTDDPLGLGFTLENQPCSGSFIVVLASSGDPKAYRSTLRPALGGFASSEAPGPGRYLRTDESCATFNQTAADGSPIYAAYLGPYDDGRQACQDRMQYTSTGTYIKHLDGVRKGPYYCMCAYDASELPDLNTTEDAETTGDRRFWTVELQHALFVAGVNPQQLFGGNFGSKTEGMVTAFQAASGDDETGSLDSNTWSSLQGITCS
jgi:hypothetical protein